MKRCVIGIILAALAGLVILLAVKIYKARNGIFEVTVCSTTDVHGAYFDSLYNGVDINRTSLANVSSYISSLRNEGIDPILVDVGDMLQGDNAAYFFNYVDTVSQHIFQRIADYLGYDVLVVGNHDVEAGHSVYDRMRRELHQPYLAANAENDADCNGLADIRESNPSGLVSDSYFLPYCIVRRPGVKIAFIGMTNANIKRWLPIAKWEGIDFTIISDFAQAQVDRVVATEKPDFVVLAIHSGAGKGEGADRENEARYLASTLRSVDLILSGHDHIACCETVSGPSGEVLILNEGNKARNVGRVNFKLERKGGKCISKAMDYELVPMESYPPDSLYMATFRDDFLMVKEFALKPIGEMAEDMYFADAVDGPSSYVTLLHKVQLESTGADISFAAPLSDKGVIHKGRLLFQDLFTIYRFENQLYVINMTGKQIKDFLEFSYHIWIDGGPRYNMDSAEGIRYEVKRSAPEGERVRIISMEDGTPFNPDSTYKVAMTSYRASGGGYHLTEGAGMEPSEVVVTAMMSDIRTLIAEYVVSKGLIVPEVSDNWKFVK